MDARDYYNTMVDWKNASMVTGAERAQSRQQDLICIMNPDGSFKVETDVCAVDVLQFVDDVLPPIITKPYVVEDACHE